MTTRRTSRRSSARRTSRPARNGLFTRPPGERLTFDVKMATVRSPGMRQYSRGEYVDYLMQEALLGLKQAGLAIERAEEDRSRGSMASGYKDDTVQHRFVNFRAALSFVLESERLHGEASGLSGLMGSDGKIYKGADALFSQWWTAYGKLTKRWPLLPE